MDLKKAAQIARNITECKMGIDDMAELLTVYKTEGITNALMIAYNAGYYRGASAKQQIADQEAGCKIIDIRTGMPAKE